MKPKFFWILLIFSLIVFRGVFFGSIYWGDNPHFFLEEVKQFQSEPLTWTSLGNNFGGINLPLWLSPLMYLWRFLPPEILFIVPAITLSLLGPIFLGKYLKLGSWVQFFSSAVYTFNTYFLLLIDGGQLGVTLSYGVFPFTVLFLKKLIDKPRFKNFYLALIVLTVNGLADPRIALVAVVTAVIWNINKIRNLLSFIPLGISWLLLNSFWLLPFVKNKNALSVLGGIDIARIKIIDPLLLFSPHWPDNLFGKINTPSIYFFGIPLLIFLGLYISKKRDDLIYLWGYLIFSALSVVPIGIVFRDSTKFYIPVIIFAGILIGQTAENMKSNLARIAILFYILFLVTPAILGKMNFVLSSRDHGDGFTKIYKSLKSNNDFYRTVWFPERHPLTFETENSPALDGKELVKLLPFASMNVGEDPFNFINKGEFVDDFKTLGIRYLILSGNPREIVKTPEEAKNWDSLLTLVGKTKGLDKLNWGTEFPVYEIPDSYPHVFSVNKLIGVIGAPLSMKYPSINFEDGIFDASILKDLDPNSFAFYFNGKKTDDLAMSLLTKYFTFPKDAVSSEWAVYSHTEYLKYKYELLQRGINFQDLDYGGGIAFSTILGEKIAFNFNVPTDGEYVLAVRSIDKKADENGLIWKLGEPQTLKKGVFVHSISNDSDMVVVNAIALVPLSELESARSLANDYLKRFRVIDGSDLEKYTDYERVSVNNDGTLKYKLDLSNNDFWIIFTDNYSEAWQAAGANTPLIHLPVYGVVNGYYTEGKNSDIEISFTGQKYFRVGVYISITTLATLLLLYYSYEKSLKRRIKN